jgi:5-deoxy-glucuronate isomerase
VSGARLPKPLSAPGASRWLARAGEADLDTGMSFGLLELDEGSVFADAAADERAVVLLSGEVDFAWDDDGETTRAVARRGSLFDERPTVLHVPAGAAIEIAAGSDAELAWVATANVRHFAARLFSPTELLELEWRGAGRVEDAALREVRTVFDDRNRAESNLVLGEVVNLPGRWSSWPPHHHPQPEIYHYRFDRAEGYGHAELGDEVLRVGEGDTVKILDGRDHPQVAAPGSAMWYLWFIRHLPGRRYTVPEFSPAHRWTMEPGAQSRRPKESS